jgi:hypothetical protein
MNEKQETLKHHTTLLDDFRSRILRNEFEIASHADTLKNKSA